MGPSSETSVCVDVLEAIADVEGVPPRELDFTLHDHVPTGALDEMYRSDQGPWELSFEVPGHGVTVQNDGTIFVDDQLIQLDS